MSDQMNGNPHQPDASPTPGRNPMQQVIDQQITPIVRPAIQSVARGVIVGFTGVRPDVVMSVAAFELGYFLGQAIQADIGTMAAFRRRFQESFEAGIRAAPLLQAPSNWNPPPEGGR